MDEIMFRAWDKRKGVMYNSPFNGKICGQNDIFSNAGDWIYMQYTGEKDINATKVFEGDIVEVGTVIGKSFSRVPSHYTNRYVVTFENARFTFGGYTFYNSYVDRIEVIGNIYENPKLTPSVSKDGGE